MTEHTTKSNLPYPDGSDQPDGPGAVAALAVALDDPAWTTFVTTTNINLGTSAGNNGEYQISSNRVHFGGFMQLGSGFFVPSGVTLTLPKPARIGLTIPDGEFRAKQAGGAPVGLSAEFVDANTIRLLAPAVSGGTVALAPVTATAPFAWAQTDTISWAFSYAGA